MPYRQYYSDLIEDFKQHDRLNKWGDVLEAQLHDIFVDKPHGDMPRWSAAFDRLPEGENVQVDLTQDTLLVKGAAQSDPEQSELYEGLRGLMPWRKGPFQFFDQFVDTEWRSDWKWQRVSPHLSPLKGRTILDVGCGSGYHMWRMLGAGAERVVGVDPTKLFFWQFEAVKKYVAASQSDKVNAHFLPMKMEDVPPRLIAFDTVFSMGVLYHRRSPLEHLSELHGALRQGGELVLETLVIEGGLGEVLMPEDRYAMMRNVWFLPTTDTLALWLRRTGFKDIRVVDQNYTTTEEQRSTDWMGFDSLKDFLNPDDPKKTAEGYPAPLRATIVATAK